MSQWPNLSMAQLWLIRRASVPPARRRFLALHSASAAGFLLWTPAVLHCGVLQLADRPARSGCRGGFHARYTADSILWKPLGHIAHSLSIRDGKLFHDSAALVIGDARYRSQSSRPSRKLMQPSPSFNVLDEIWPAKCMTIVWVMLV